MASGTMRGVRVVSATFCVAALVAALSLCAGASAQAPRACTSAEVAGSRTPLTVEEGSDGAQPSFLLPGRPYTAVVVEELGFSDVGTTAPGSVRVTALSPSALTLTRGSLNGRPAYRFRAPRSGAVRLAVTWTIDTRDAGACTASGTVTR